MTVMMLMMVDDGDDGDDVMTARAVMVATAVSESNDGDNRSGNVGGDSSDDHGNGDDECEGGQMTRAVLVIA